MIKTRELHEVPVLFQLLSHPDVYPYVRHKAQTSDEYYFITKQTIEAESRGELISRTILDEYYQPIGTINLFDITNNCGFLATWIGQPYFGKGYNQMAKQLFFNELFFEKNIQAIFIKIRQTNIRSLKAMAKLPYVSDGKFLYPDVYEQINRQEDTYNLFVISRQDYIAHTKFITDVPGPVPVTALDGSIS